ncbi:MAG TPA: hypothetical protein VGR81_05085 [Candidatus Acidoferrales bacterium]|nr:hypothetical protein [Candidatus Acidoferrales bacterium]
MDNGALGGFDPFAIFGDVRINAHGAKDRFAGGADDVGVFQNAFGKTAEITAATSAEASGLGVTVNRRATGQVVILLDVRRRMPLEEFLFNVFALRMVTDGAFAGMTPEIGVVVEIGARRFATHGRSGVLDRVCGTGSGGFGGKQLEDFIAQGDGLFENFGVRVASPEAWLAAN